ncbi:IclR family transcriptional regulator [Niallia circulans]|uniref:IclR family transcriptional regulator n=1 Tax=Niallia circulans TaxID=1397 RepID=UPI001F492772|nr:IclR family transcriptional regulator [Niallia circulans]MCF2650573.1 IclR family transcriptional regulator [Niallia circulans]
MTSKTVSKALCILDLFTNEKPSWGLREISRHLDMSHTIVYRLLTTFEEKGYIFQNPETQKYELGIKFIELSNVVDEHLRITEIIQPIMKKISLETGESVVLTVIDDEEGLFVKIVESEQQVRFAESVGRRRPLYIGATHKVILAHLPNDIQNKIVEQGIANQARQIESKEAFFETLKEIKKQGWFYTSGETFNDVAALSIPLFDNKQNILGSLSIAGPKHRLSSDVIENVLPILQENREAMNSIFNKIFFPSSRSYLIKQLS